MEPKPDFSGWASKADLRCSDGRTIREGAFKHQDGVKVPLVWQHGHKDNANVLGYAILEHRQGGTYTYGYFNNTENGRLAKEQVEHGDIDLLSVHANKLLERGTDVLHGEIKEVSLVLAGANPGAFIDQVYLQHGESIDPVDDEVIIYTGLHFQHADEEGDTVAVETQNTETKTEDNSSDKTIGEIIEGMTGEQKEVLYYMVGTAAEDDSDDDDDAAASEAKAKADALQHGEILSTIQEGFTDMTRNLFETNGSDSTITTGRVLNHAATTEIFTDAIKNGSMKDSFLEHAATYGIDNIDYLFPDAKTLQNSPELLSRRTEWVASLIAGTRHSPFSRIKTVVADITADEARAKGYVKGTKKKEEIVKLLKRVTTPTTIYKKQKLDRDDVIDITDLDVIAWLKAEMRLMLDEELARAILIGDGREVDDDDKIDEDHIRPIAKDDEMYTHVVTIPANTTGHGIVEAVLRSRTHYRGTGTPTFYTTDEVLTDLILLTDKMDRRLYDTEAALAAAMRVDKIVTVEPMNDTPEYVGIVVNVADYTVGADKGGAISMFDDFDIDYNQQKYLIETRVSGALTKPKSAIAIKRGASSVVTPETPLYDDVAREISIPTQAGVEYRIDNVPVTGDIVISETTEVQALAKPGYSFPANTTVEWTFIYE